MAVTAKDILKELEALGRESYKKMLMNNYGVKEPCFGVRVGPVTTDLSDYQCQIPSAPDTIRKIQKRGIIGKKRKTVKG